MRTQKSRRPDVARLHDQKLLMSVVVDGHDEKSDEDFIK
jgi:hypothetical protein